jgi:hypothetical protein
MKAPLVKPVRCAIYTRVSTDHGLDQEFNSLDADHVEQIATPSDDPMKSDAVGWFIGDLHPPR